MTDLTPSRIAAALAVVLLLPAAGAATEDPTLTRLSFWVAPERLEEFTRAYETRLLPLLVERGFKPSDVPAPAAADSVFSRLFELDSPEGWLDQAVTAMMMDATVNDVVRSMGVEFGDKKQYGLLTTPVAEGRVEAAGPGSRHWQTYDVVDGLAGAWVGTIAQAADGAIWFGTGSPGASGAGVSRFDGRTWQTFRAGDGLVHDYVKTVSADGEGNLWFGYGQAHGVTRYDGTSWRTFTTEDGLPSDETVTIHHDRAGEVWVGTDAGVARFDGQSWESFTTDDGLASNTVNEIMQDSDGVLWLGTGAPSVERGGVSRYDGSAWSSFDTEGGGLTEPVVAMAQDGDAGFWFATSHGGLSRYDGQRWTTYSSGTGRPEWTYTLALDAHANLWAATFPGGVRRFDGASWHTFTTEDGLASDNALTLEVDGEGNLWFGTYGSGVTRLDPSLTTYSKADGLAEDFAICLLHDRDGALWVGTNRQGVSRFDGHRWTTFSANDGLAHVSVRSMAQDRDGDIWFGTHAGVSRYDGRRWWNYGPEEGLGSHVYAILQDRDGDMWFGTDAGVSRFDGEAWTTFTERDGLAGNTVLSTVEDRDGVLWFGSRSGVSCYDGTAWTTFTTADGLVNDDVNELLLDSDGVLWVGTYGGLSRFDGDTWQSFTKQDGLAADVVSAILQDRQGVLWIGTLDGGVSRYDGRTFQALTREDGLGNNTVMDLVAGDGDEIWLATSAGVTRFEPPPVAAPRVAITAVVADRRYHDVSTVSIPSTVSLTAFEFAGYSFKTRPGAIVYRYRLVGHDDEWRATHDERVEYADLPRGEYVFEVIAVDRDLGYSESPASASLHVVYPLAWFAWIAALGLAVAVAAWQTVRLVQRERNLRATNQQLRAAQTQLVQAEKMSTLGLLAGGVAHEINNPLQAILESARRILLYPDDVKRHRQSASLVEQAAQRAAVIVRNLLDFTRASSGDMATVDLNAVVQNTLALLQHHFDEHGLQIDLELEAVPDLEGNFNDLSTVVTNLMMNAADATRSLPRSENPRIHVGTSVEAGHVQLTVRDHGMGIPPAAQKRIFDPFYTSKQVGAGTGLGLAIVQGVVERHGGRIELHSEPGRTEFIVLLPYHALEVSAAEARP